MTVTATTTHVSGDINDTMLLRVDGVEDLDAVSSVQAHVSRSGVAAVTLDATVVDTVARHVEVDFGDDDGWLATLDVAERVTVSYEIELQIAFSTGVTRTTAKLALPIRGQLA